jgi:hypothetical protein
VKYFEEDEFENCGNELRKEAEAILTSHLDPEMKNLNKEFDSLGKNLEKAFNQLSSKRLQNFKQIFLSDIELEKLKKIKTNYLADGDLSDPEKANLGTLKNRMFDFLIELNEKKNKKELLIKDTKEVLDRVMNAASHHGESSLYRQELKDAIEGIKNLKEHLNE